MSQAKTRPFNPGLTWLLHARKFKENSAICELLTEKNGKVSVIINNTNSKKKRLLLAPFQGLWLEYQGSNELKKVTALESAGISFGLYHTKSICGIYLNELLLKTLPAAEPVPRIFHAYQACLQQLAQLPTPAYALRTFELTLLQSLGYGIPFDQAASSTKQYFLYCYENGFVAIDDEQENSFSKQQLEKISLQQWQDTNINYLAKKLFHRAFQPILNYRPLKCKELLQDMVIS